MKRGNMPRRKTKPKRRRRVDSPYATKPGKSLTSQREIDVANRQAFRQEAQRQRVCAVCGEAGSFDAHHVIEKKYLKANNLPLYNTENSLRLCDEQTDNDCHGGHTSGMRRIPLRCLTDRNIQYAFYLLGPAAYYYLKARYTGEDERVERAFAELEDDAA